MPSRLENLTKDLEEVKSLLNSATRQRVKDVLILEMKRIETDLTLLKESEPEGAIVSSPVVSQIPRSKCYDVKLTNYAWDQSEKFVKIFVSLKDVQNLSKDKISCIFEDRSMELSVHELDNRNYFLSIKNLQEKIDCSKSLWKVKTDTVIIMLAKLSSGKEWKAVTALEAASKESKMPPPDNSEDPSAGLLNIMKNLYDNGDDEIKRTIAQAWTQSVATNPGSNI